VRLDNYKLVWGNPSMLKKEESIWGERIIFTDGIFFLYRKEHI
jgi:hypothetical protein